MFKKGDKVRIQCVDPETMSVIQRVYNGREATVVNKFYILNDDNTVNWKKGALYQLDISGPFKWREKNLQPDYQHMTATKSVEIEREMHRDMTYYKMMAMQMNEDCCKALSEVFSKHGCQIDPDAVYELIEAMIVFKDYGITSAEKAHRLLYEHKKMY